MLYVDGICPVCLQEQLAQAVRVIEAAEQYKRYVEYYFRGKISRYRDCVDARTELDNAIAKFKGGQDASL